MIRIPFLILTCTFCLSTSFGQVVDYLNPKVYEIGPIRILGADNFDHQAIKLIAGLKQGAKIKIPGDDISNAIRNLWAEDLFSDVSINIDKITGDIAYLSIELKPRPKLSRYRFEGVSKKDADKIREEIKLFAGRNITENLIFNTRSKVVGFYREKGFFSVNVNIERTQDSLMNNSEIFVIKVDKGERVKISKINFYGAESVKIGKLKRAMKDTKEKGIMRIFSRSKFSVSAFNRDKDAVVRKFQEIGLRDAEIARDSVYLVDDKHLVLDIYVVIRFILFRF